MPRYKRHRSGAPQGALAVGIAIASIALITASCSSSTSPPSQSALQPPVAPEANADAKVKTTDDSSPWRVASAPRLRDLTVAVRVVPPTPIVAAYQALARRHPRLRDLLNAHSEGGFGSGFVVVHQSEPQAVSRIFVVTNQHVVGLAEEATIEFDGHDDPLRARVIHVDRNYDLAILALEEASSDDSKPLPKEGFGFSESAPHDQDAIVAAGYPGIAGAPSYQVTKGHISNERVMLPINGSKQHHVQHTAPIDSGSSGGPLLNENNEVLGINTLKIRGREGVGLAVPSDAVQRALAQALIRLNEDSTQERDRKLQACEQLLEDLKAGNLQAIERGLSSQLTAKQGPLSLGLLPDNGTDWGEAFMRSPEDVFLRALALRVSKTLSSPPDGETRRCQMKDEGLRVVGLASERPLSFRTEQGRLKLADAKLIQGGTTSFLQPAVKKKKKWKPSLR